MKTNRREQILRKRNDVFDTHKWRISISIFALIFITFLTSCDQIQELVRPQGDVSEFEDALQRDYDDAVADAQKVEASEISTNLIALTPDNPRVAWDNGRILMATWIASRFVGTYAEYSLDEGKYVPKTVPVNLSFGNVWVTSVPELKNFCKAQSLNSVETLHIRLKQVLGLTPTTDKGYLIEMWVNPDDLFRPCYDPEIDDDRCGLTFPADVDPEHKAWFENEQETNTFPWTRLGYTYDWGNSQGDVIGLSEFVIETGTAVSVHSVQTTAAYCQ